MIMPSSRDLIAIGIVAVAAIAAILIGVRAD